MSNHIFTTVKSNNHESFYCLAGKEDFVDESGYPRLLDADNTNIAAKIIKNKRGKHFNDNTSYNSYYIKCSPNNTLYNPIELHAIKDTKTQYGFIDKTCKNEWSFKQVDHHVFYKYLSFLQTKNISWLKDAERELK
jgi:hypothetical protein